MLLIKRRSLSEKQLARNQRNAQLSTGAKTLMGKVRVAMNAVRHGLYSHSVYASMQILGENPREFDRLYVDLLEEWRPRTATGMRLVRHLAELMWKLDRVTRAELAVASRRVEALQAERALTAQRLGQYRYEGLEADVAAAGLMGVEDSVGKFEEMLLHLDTLKRRASKRDLSPAYEEPLQRLYGQRLTSRGRLIAGLFRGLAMKQKASEPIDATLFQELEDLIDQELKQVEQQYILFQQEHVKLPDSLRDAQLAPSERFYALFIRRENALARQIDRTIRLLLALQRKDGRAARGRR